MFSRSSSSHVQFIKQASSSSSSSGTPEDTFKPTIYPIAKEIVYPNDDGSSPIETSYTYSWHPNTVQMSERVITFQAVSSNQNGSGTSAVRIERFDEFGNLVWMKDERGVIFHKEYDVVSDNVTRSIDDVDDARSSNCNHHEPANCCLALTV